MFVLPVILIALIYLLYYYLTRTFDHWKIKKVRGPEPMVLFGNVYQSVMRRTFLGNIVKKVYDQFPEEQVVGLYMMRTPVLLVRDLELVKQIMIKDFELFSDRGLDFSKKGLGANLFHADGDTWRVLRNRFTSLFTSGKLKNMVYLMTEQADMFINHVSKITQEQPEQEVHRLVQKYTISSISSCAFGIDMNMEEDDVMFKKINEFDKILFELNIMNEILMMWPNILSKLNVSLFPKTIVNFFYSLARNIIKERNGSPIGRKDFMDLILELRQQGEIKGTRRSDAKELQLEFNEDVIAAQAFVFYVAGYETSATTMTFMLYELARNQDIQDKVIAELDVVLQKYNGKVTYDTINDLKYMGQVFDETLRKYPVVDMMDRRAQDNYKFPGLDLEIEKGSAIIVSAQAIHHDANYYPDPEKFDPERFAQENANERHPCAYIPFGIGPRNCIGMRFAKVQSRVCVAKILSRFRVEMTKKTPEKVELNPYRVISNPRGGMFLKFVNRT